MKKRRWLTLILWIALAFYLCAQTGEESKALSGFLAEKIYQFVSFLPSMLSYDTLHYFLRKSAHFIVHLILGILAYRAVETEDSEKTLTFIKAFTISVLFASLDEWIQTLTISRDPMIADVMLNLSGAIIGTSIGLVHTFLKSDHK